MATCTIASTRASCTGLAGAVRATVYQEGITLTLNQAAQEALAALTPQDTPAQSDDSRSEYELTARELEVLRLLVLGLTDREIADVLFISPRTAQGHVGRIYDKLGVNSRSGAVATALGAGLVAAPRASSHRES